VPEDRVAQVLDPPAPDSAGRYHRPGERALYVTREADWAMIAIARYIPLDGKQRLVVPLRLSAARVVDQRDQDACAALGINPVRSAARWQKYLAAGEEPPSWANVAAARAAGADGITDPSRGITDGWHLALFRWNEPGASTVEVDGDPFLLEYEEARARWAAPEGWLEASGDLTY
jgi:hypothetical protein